MLAGIDIGSNSVRMLIGTVEDNKVRVADDYMAITRLGQTSPGEPLNKVAVNQTLEALKSFKGVIAARRIEKEPIVVATSAVREALDSAEFIQQINETMGWNVRVLSAAEEAEYAYRGATSAVLGNCIVIDAGGGSTELIWRAADGTLQSRSVKVGSVRLLKRALDDEELEAALNPLLKGLPEGERTLVGVGGTITSLAAVLNGLSTYSRGPVEGYVMSMEPLERIYKTLCNATVQERLLTWPVLKERTDTIIPGTRIYLMLLKILKAEKIIVSNSGLLDGVLLDV
ncbi:MAG: hypothetical protein PHQ49_04720 [Clostridia bacterium]|nr:hypothetical protein [Clostridia bacterium]